MSLRILMLAPSGAGKTTYMASMYGALQQPISGFHLRAQQEDVHDQLLKLGEQIQAGEYPLPTDQRERYAFDLFFNNRPLVSFDWVDIRGDTISQRQDSPQAQQLVHDLQNADGIVLFCDATLLAQQSRRAKLPRLMSLVSQACTSLTRRLTMSFVLTKTDLVDVSQLDQSTIEPFWDTVIRNEHIHAARLQVACGCRPVNVEHPVLHAIQHGVQFHGESLRLQSHRLRDERSQLIARSQTLEGMIEDGIGWLFGAATSRQRADRLNPAISESLDQLRHAEVSAKRLAQHLESTG